MQFKSALAAVCHAAAQESHVANKLARRGPTESSRRWGLHLQRAVLCVVVMHFDGVTPLNCGGQCKDGRALMSTALSWQAQCSAFRCMCLEANEKQEDERLAPQSGFNEAPARLSPAANPSPVHCQPTSKAKSANLHSLPPPDLAHPYTCCSAAAPSRAHPPSTRSCPCGTESGHRLQGIGPQVPSKEGCLQMLSCSCRGLYHTLPCNLQEPLRPTPAASTPASASLCPQTPAP